MRKLDYEQTTPEWLSMRRNCIGASDAPIIMGLSPYKTREQLLHEKVYGNNTPMTASMQYGKDMEPYLLECCSSFSSGKPVFPGGVYAHDEREWQIASIDGVSLDLSEIYEVKAANKADHAIACDFKIPPKYYPQLQHQISVMELKGSFYFSYHKGEGKLNWCPRDDAFIAEMLKLEMAFYEEMCEARRNALESTEIREVIGWQLLGKDNATQVK